jgi:diguanylate cyclase (GGDEF)-like protein/PAS domain S-box-containing protein
MSKIGKQKLTVPFMWLIIAAGAAACVLSIIRLPLAIIDMRFLLVAIVTLGFGSRLSVKIPRVHGEVTVSDTFIFLTVLLYGGEAAVLLATADALSSSLRFCKNKTTILFNAAVMAFATALTVASLNFFFGSIKHLMRGDYSADFIMAVCVMGLVQYISNSGLAAVRQALKANESVWQMWRRGYLWTSITYFTGASAAAIIAKVFGGIGIYAFLVTTPIIAVVYFTYRTYLKNVEASLSQAEQAQRHVAALQASEARFRGAFERFRSAFDYAAIGMALVAKSGRWLQVNRSLCEILGYSEAELLSTNFQAITHPTDLAQAMSNINQLIEGKVPTYQMEKRYFHKHGHEVWVLLSVSLVRDTETKSQHFIFQIQDITDRKRAEDRLLHDAFHDALTGLPNRALFVDHLKLGVQRARRREDMLFAVLFLDLDRFKVINDSLGHMVGDQLLVGIARRLETCLRPGDTIARLGGDEFTVLLEDIADEEEVIEVAQRLQKELTQPFNLGGHEVFTSASIGIALSTTGFEKPEDLLRDADTAMYRAKSLGKARHELFDRGMHTRALSQLQLETDLRRAIDRQEFIIHYQPIVSLENFRLAGFEALVRWQHPERGLIPPTDFIRIAEETGLIVPLGHWVLREACYQMREWQKIIPADPPLSISVNLSSKQFMQPDLIGQVKAVLDESKIDPRSLKLEITESVVMENIEAATEMLKQLRDLGVELSIDDFGTGYSSLSYLHRFPISTLKIDRSFVSSMADNNENTEIVRTIVMLARNLGMKVVAEGVETKEQLAQLRALECDYGQGYFFSRPTDVDATGKLLIDVEDYLMMPSNPDGLKPLEYALVA